MTPRVRYRRRAAVVSAVVVVTAAAVVAAVELSKARIAADAEALRPLAVGECVVVSADSPNGIQAQRSDCVADPSFTVGAVTDTTGNCPTAEYQHFAAPVAERQTAGLCLVPNLVADHCYRLGMPIGVMERADCAESRTGGPTTGLLVQVTNRLDVHDRFACPSTGGRFAWPYPSPARTYCTATLS
jgi:hypothetical protein